MLLTKENMTSIDSMTRDATTPKYEYQDDRQTLAGS